jgi:hypothetical protein
LLTQQSLKKFNKYLPNMVKDDGILERKKVKVVNKIVRIRENDVNNEGKGDELVSTTAIINEDRR